jgi:hypothetical protein
MLGGEDGQQIPPAQSTEPPANRKRANPWADAPVNILKTKSKKDESENDEIYALTLQKMREGSRNTFREGSTSERPILAVSGRLKKDQGPVAAQNSVSCASCGTFKLVAGAPGTSEGPVSCSFCDRAVCLDCVRECADCAKVFCPTCSLGR